MQTRQMPFALGLVYENLRCLTGPAPLAAINRKEMVLQQAK